MADYMDMMHSASSSESSKGTVLGRKQGELTRDLHVVDESTTKTQKLEASGTPGAFEKSTERECVRLMETHSVQVGESWGFLPESKQKLWSSLDCDDVVGKIDEQRGSESHTSKGGTKSDVETIRQIPVLNKQGSIDAATTGADNSITKKVSKRTRKTTKKEDWTSLRMRVRVHSLHSHSDGDRVTRQQTYEEITDKVRTVTGASKSSSALPSVTTESVEWCTTMKKRHKVIPMKSWGPTGACNPRVEGETL